MSIISPIPQQSIIKLYSGVPWDSGYQDVRLFDSDTERESYLIGLQRNAWTACSIVKENRIRLEGQVTDYVDCNYLSFVNTGLGVPKKFFAFIKSVEFVNINTFDVMYEIDWIQSYLFDFVIESCFVEREHVNDDTFGKHTIDEGLDAGEYTIDKIVERTHAKSVIIQLLPDNPESKLQNGVVTCLESTGYSVENLGTLDDFLRTFNDEPERIVSITMGTIEMISDGGVPGMFIDGFTSIRDNSVFKWGGQTYIPKNNKMLCYPFKFFTIDNYGGELETFRWEECTDQLGVPKCDFQLVGSAIPKPMLQCYPLKYKGWESDGIASNAVQNFAIGYDNFPMVPYATDAFRAWVSQYSTSIATNAVATVGQTVMQAVGVAAMTGGNPVGAAIGFGQMAVGAIGNAANAYQQYKDHKIHSRQMHGSVGSAGIEFANQRVGFRETQFSARLEYAIIADKKMTRYGYKVDEVKVPNIRGRRYFNYVKCYEAHVEGAIPVDARDRMTQALQAGVTFWHTDNINAVYDENPIV